MEVILVKDVQNCGFKDDIVKVKDGYARNFLIPKGFAVMANDSTKKILEENIKQRTHKESTIVKDAELQREKLNETSIKI